MRGGGFHYMVKGVRDAFLAWGVGGVLACVRRSSAFGHSTRILSDTGL